MFFLVIPGYKPNVADAMIEPLPVDPEDIMKRTEDILVKLVPNYWSKWNQDGE